MRTEAEPFGITYDRFRVGRLLGRLAAGHRLERALEVEARGAKACPSLYSIALGLAGCDVWLANGHPGSLAHWARLGVESRAHIVRVSAAGLPFADASFDLVWNFVTLQREPRLDAALAEMARVSRGLVLVVFQNGYNLGYPWHRFLHRLFDLAWTHGRPETFFAGRMRVAFRGAGIEPVETLLLDQVPWHDPPGFRDVRLHRSGLDIGREEEATWAVPAIDYHRTGFPLAYRALGFLEELPVPRLLRWPVNHLYALVGRVCR